MLSLDNYDEIPLDKDCESIIEKYIQNNIEDEYYESIYNDISESLYIDFEVLHETNRITIYIIIYKIILYTNDKKYKDDIKCLNNLIIKWFQFGNEIINYKDNYLGHITYRELENMKKIHKVIEKIIIENYGLNITEKEKLYYFVIDYKQ